MPVYDYKCQQHGIFSELATMSESGQPTLCPQCSLLSARVIMVAPEVLDMSPANRSAHQTNEKSQHEPEFSSKERRSVDHEHNNGCGCTGRKKGSKLMYTAQGDKMFPSMRPWMISH